MSVNPETALLSFKTMLEAQLPVDVTVIEAPTTVTEGKGAVVLHLIPSGPLAGGMDGSQEMGTVAIQTKCVGKTFELALAVSSAVLEAVDDHWSSVTGVMGPPTVSLGGMMGDGSMFNVDHTVYLEVSQ